MTVFAYEDLPSGEASYLRRNQRRFLPHQVEMAKAMPGMIWVEPPKWRATPPNWAATRRAVFERDKFTCTYCGAKDIKLHCDHVIPVSRGGTHDHLNLTTACQPCNCAKRDKMPDEWFRYLRAAQGWNA